MLPHFQKQYLQITTKSSNSLSARDEQDPTSKMIKKAIFFDSDKYHFPRKV